MSAPASHTDLRAQRVFLDDVAAGPEALRELQSYVERRLNDDADDDLVFYSSVPLPERGSAVIDSDTDDD